MTDSLLPEQIIQLLWDQTTWIKFPLEFVKPLKADGAVLLGYYLNTCIKHKSVNRQAGWFYCRQSVILEKTGMSVNRQSELTRKFIELELIETKKVGIPAKRWIRFNWTGLWRLIQSVQPDYPNSGSQDLMNSGSDSYQEEEWKRKEKAIRETPDTLSLSEQPMFFENKTKTNITEFDKIIANQLHTYVTETLRLRRGWTKSKWADQIRLLRNDVNQDTDRIENAVEWLKSSKFKLQNAKHFRNAFGIIEDRMLKKPKPIPISPEAERIVKAVRGLGWPKGSLDGLPAAIQQSIVNHNKFREVYFDWHQDIEDLPKTKVIKSSDKKQRMTRFSSIIRTKFFTSDFIKRWFDNVHQQVWSWDEWSGDLSPYVFSTTSRMFHKMGSTMSVEYSGYTHLWNEFIKDIT